MIEVVIVADPVLRRFQNLDRIVKEEILFASLDSSAWLEASSKEFAPKRTGNLARAIAYRPRVLPGRTEVVATVAGTAPYARFVEEGTGIYHVPDAHLPFRARRHTLMRWENATGVHYARVVQGMRPRPFIEPSVRLNHPRIIERYHQIPRRVAARLAV